MANKNIKELAETTSLNDTDALEVDTGGSSLYILWSSLKTLINTYISSAVMTLTNKTLTAPTIADFTNAAHDHGDADDGGAVVSASATVSGVVELATNSEALTGTDTVRAITAANLKHVMTVLFMPRGVLLNGKLSVTVSSSDLIIAIKTLSDADPSASDPVYVRIGDTVRTISAATSLTLADATNWMNLGAAETAAVEQDLFAYLVWDSNSSVVGIGVSRKPDGNLVSDFSATTTNEKHLGGYAGFTSTDEVENIGRFAATLSAAAGHVWTVPTFTAANLIQHPIYETRWLTWVPTRVGYSANPTATLFQYKIVYNNVYFQHTEGTNGTSNATNNTSTLPLTVDSSSTFGGPLTTTVDNTVVQTTPGRAVLTGGSSTITFSEDTASGAWTNTGGKRCLTQGWFKW